MEVTTTTHGMAGETASTCPSSTQPALMAHSTIKSGSTTKANVLVIGNSGVGKSTLINAVLGEETALAGFGTQGTTRQLRVYENATLRFRLIDTAGFEPSFLKRHAAIHAVKSWSRNSAKAGNTADARINAIWFCIDGTSSKLFPSTIRSLSQATSMWPSVPVIAVITKSYSVPDRRRNIELVTNAFSSQSHRTNLRKILPVVAQTYMLNEDAYAAPEGIEELIDATNDMLPDGCRAAEKDIARFKLNRRRVLSQSVVAAATTSGALVGAVPIPFPDAAILGPVEIAQINALARIYGIAKNEASRKFFDSIVQVGTVSLAAQGAISALKAIPGVNLGAAALNAVIAGSIVAALGEGTIVAFEQVSLGNKTVADTEWVRGLMQSRLSAEFIATAKAALAKSGDGMSARKIAQLVLGAVIAEKGGKK
ncbi:MAG: GTP-binding DUF697 domain-containing protein [Bifidobacterium sp.]|jgi:uncharacterized protein (DUF697 family)/GTPase Era involved in 16S rRNA processing|nr:GTP-binding DUF697 domain-containing protein [Bifidobacterium sp.]